MDTLKEFSEITVPDPRSGMFAAFDSEKGEFRRREIEDHYGMISKIALHKGVPEKVREHFETTKNLLLYSWFVYRFIPVAEFHAASTLEFALKLKTGGKIKGLSKLISHAVDEGWVKNQGFSVWQNRMRMAEEEKKMYEQWSKLSEEEFDFPEKEYDYLEILKKSIPALRNEYAHGSSFLHPGGYEKLEICAEFINQLFEGTDI